MSITNTGEFCHEDECQQVSASCQKRKHKRKGWEHVMWSLNNARAFYCCCNTMSCRFLSFCARLRVVLSSSSSSSSSFSSSSSSFASASSSSCSPPPPAPPPFPSLTSSSHSFVAVILPLLFLFLFLFLCFCLSLFLFLFSSSSCSSSFSFVDVFFAFVCCSYSSTRSSSWWRCFRKYNFKDKTTTTTTTTLRPTFSITFKQTNKQSAANKQPVVWKECTCYWTNGAHRCTKV